MLSVLSRHMKIALQLSGGRDSIACLYLLREHLGQITVYWVNTGAAYPETIAIMTELKALCPQFVEIDGNQPGVIAQHGIPSDIVPASHTPIGLAGSGSGGQLIQDRYSCCMRAIMLPLHERMLADGVTLIIRGQKDSDTLKSTVRSGDIVDGVEYLFPLQDWSGSQVTDYLHKVGAPVARFYDMLTGTPDCLTCSAYWEEGAARYLKAFHPDAHAEVQRRLNVIQIAVAGSIAAFNIEVKEE